MALGDDVERIRKLSTSQENLVELLAKDHILICMWKGEFIEDAEDLPGALIPNPGTSKTVELYQDLKWVVYYR